MPRVRSRPSVQHLLSPPKLACVLPGQDSASVKSKQTPLGEMKLNNSLKTVLSVAAAQQSGGSRASMDIRWEAPPPHPAKKPNLLSGDKARQY